MNAARLPAIIARFRGRRRLRKREGGAQRRDRNQHRQPKPHVFLLRLSAHCLESAVPQGAAGSTAAFPSALMCVGERTHANVSVVLLEP
jgi:hypothetical protein